MNCRPEPTRSSIIWNGLRSWQARSHQTAARMPNCEFGCSKLMVTLKHQSWLGKPYLMKALGGWWSEAKERGDWETLGSFQPRDLRGKEIMNCLCKKHKKMMMHLYKAYEGGEYILRMWIFHRIFSTYNPKSKLIFFCFPSGEWIS